MKLQLLAAALCTVLAQGAFAADPSLATDKDKFSYGLGMMVGERVLKNYGEIDYELLMKGMQAQRQGDETLLSIEEAQAALEAEGQRVAAERAAVASTKGAAFLADNAAREGVSVTGSGLQYEVITAAEGAKPALEDKVKVHYVGTLMDGTEFDSSIARGEPTEFPLQGVIPGWTEGLQLMNVGSKFRFVIPSDLAYGERGAGQAIGPGETLVFEVELLEILGK